MILKYWRKNLWRIQGLPAFSCFIGNFGEKNLANCGDSPNSPKFSPRQSFVLYGIANSNYGYLGLTLIHIIFGLTTHRVSRIRVQCSTYADQHYRQSRDVPLNILIASTCDTYTWLPLNILIVSTCDTYTWLPLNILIVSTCDTYTWLPLNILIVSTCDTYTWL